MSHYLKSSAVFTDGHAISDDTIFFNNPDNIDELDWGIINCHNTYSKEWKRKKQAEFLIYNALLWELIEAEKLNNVIDDLQNQDIIKIEEKDPHTKSMCFNVLPKAMIQVMEYLNKHQDKKQVFDKALKMIKGYESSYNLSLLSKVYWTIEKEKIDPLNTVNAIENIKNWNDSTENDFADKDVIKALNHVINLRKEANKLKSIAS